MKKRLLSLVMLFCMTLSLLPAAALAAPEEETVEPAPVQVAVSAEESAAAQEGSGVQEEDLFYQYMLRQARGEQGSVSLFSTDGLAKSKLGALDQQLYEKLEEKIDLVASGDLDSTIFVFSPADFGADGTYTAADLGVSAIVSGGYITQEAIDAMHALLDFDFSAVNDALVTDHPYELYWYNKTSKDGDPGGSRIFYPSLSASSKDGEWCIYYSKEASEGHDPNLTIIYAVEQAYAAGERDYPWDDAGTESVYTHVKGEKAADAVLAATNAQRVVDTHTGESDFQRLTAYKDYICAAVSYDYDAAGASNVPYGDPWQLVNVFDGKDDAKVVCEGYSKAFQFLCDLTDFDSDDIQCYSVSGTMTGGTGAGSHMWNIVTMPDKQHYLVDVTNVDEGSIGAPDKLFFKRVEMRFNDAGEPAELTAMDGEITYTYDDREYVNYYYSDDPETLIPVLVQRSMVDLFGPEILLLSDADYGEFQVTYDAGRGYVDKANHLKTTTVTEYRNATGDLLTPQHWGEEGALIFFDGWFKPEDTAAATAEGLRADCADVTLNAKWKCGVTFDGNGGTPSSPCEYGELGSTVPVPSVTRGTGDEYTLDGWYDKATGGTKKLEADAATYTVNDADTLYAQWQAKVNFNANGGTPAETIAYVPLGDTTVLPAVTRDGCVLDGWYTAAEGGDKVGVARETYTVTAPATLYAHWTCEVTFDPNGGRATETSRTVPCNAAIGTLPEARRDGYVFDGWYNAAGEKMDGTETVTAAMTLTAQWGHELTLAPNVPAGVTVTIGETALPEKVFVPEGTAWSAVTLPGGLIRSDEGYAFLDWFTASDGSGQTAAAQDGDVTADKTLYAGWTFSAALDAGDGTVKPASVTLTEGFPVGEGTLPDPTLDNWDFQGWFTAADGGTKVDADTVASKESHSTLYAHWTYIGITGTMTASDGSLTWVYLNDKVTVTDVTGSVTGISVDTPVLMACYKDGQMISVQFIRTSGMTADVTDGATMVKLFWVDANAGFSPRCACATLLPAPDPA